MKDDKHELAVLKSGDVFLMPKNTPHSPRRADGSWTYVVEKTRSKDETDRFIWPCEKCGTNLYATQGEFVLAINLAVSKKILDTTGHPLHNPV